LVSIWGIVILSLPRDKGWYLFGVLYVILSLPWDKGWYLFGVL
jgi:hypothetical protein